MTYKTPSVATYRRGYLYEIKQALQEYILEIEIRKYTQKTIRSYRNNLNLFVRYLEEEAEVFETEDLSLANVRMFSQYMVKRGSNLHTHKPIVFPNIK